MRAALFLVAAALIAAAPASAAVYLSIKQAQALMFPHVKLQPRFLTLTSEQAEAIASVSGQRVRSKDLKAWRAADGGWFVVDQVQGRDDWLTYALAINRDGIVTGLEILECAADFDTVRMPEWLDQFRGASIGDNFHIQPMSGATLSSRHITDGVKRVLATYALVLKPPPQF